MNSSSKASDVSFTFLVSIVEVSVACCGVDSSEQSAGATQSQANETSTMETKKVKDTSEAFDELFNS